MQNAGLIREVRGVMTRFEPLTEEIVAACTQDGLTYAELSDALSAYGLSIDMRIGRATFSKPLKRMTRMAFCSP